jgi:hypothetical protein
MHSNPYKNVTMTSPPPRDNDIRFLDLVLEHQYHQVSPPPSPNSTGEPGRSDSPCTPVTLMTMISDGETLTDGMQILQPLFRADKPIRTIQSSAMSSFVGHHQMKLQSVEQVEMGPYAQHTFQILSDLDMDKFSTLLMVSIRTALSRERGWSFASECHTDYSISGPAGGRPPPGVSITSHKMSFTYMAPSAHPGAASDNIFSTSPVRGQQSMTYHEQDAIDKPYGGGVPQMSSYPYEYDQSFNMSNAVTPGRMGHAS